MIRNIKVDWDGNANVWLSCYNETKDERFDYSAKYNETNLKEQINRGLSLMMDYINK